MERQYTRIDTLRNILDDSLKSIKDEEVKRCAYVHLYGVGQAAAFLSMKRGFDRKTAELAEVAGMLHDYYKYFFNDEKNHAHKSADIAKDILIKTNEYSKEEIDTVYNAIYSHSDKEDVGTPFDEILKDADEMQHYFRNPVEDYYFQRYRVQNLIEELAINTNKENNDLTRVYFVRHAIPNFNNHNDATRELTEKGLKDRILVTDYLWDKDIDLVYSSPYKRTVDTIKDFADKKDLNVETIRDLRERKVGDEWIEDFKAFAYKQWENMDYKLDSGESLRETQVRNILALKNIIKNNEGKNIVIGTHGTALSTIINYFDNTFLGDSFFEIVDAMPLIVEFTFCKNEAIEIKKYDVFTNKHTIIMSKK